MDHAETDAVIQQHRTAVETYARLCCPDPQEASDLAMEALTRAERSSAYYGGRPETAWRPFLLAEVRRTAADWAVEARATALAPDFRLWYGQLVTAFGPEDTMRRGEEASLVLQAFNAMQDRARHALWHQVIEGEPGPDGEAEAAVDALRDSCLRRLTDRAPDADCHHYSRMLGAVVRGTNQHTSEDLEEHLAHCPNCSSGLRDLQLITHDGVGRREALAARLLMWGHAAYLAECDRLRTPPSGLPEPDHAALVHVPDAVRPRRRRFPVGAVAVGVVLAVAAVAGVAAAIVPSLSEDGTAGVGPSGGPTARTGAAAAPDTSGSSSGSPSAESPSTASGETTIALASSATKRCLQITDGSALFSTAPVQAGCDSTTPQQWKVLDVEGDAVKLRNAASSLCLDTGGDPTQGAAVSQRPCTIGRQEQMWLLKVYRRSGYVVAVCKTDTKLQLGLKSKGRNSAVVLVSGQDGLTGRFVLDDALK